jgi:hypothetical protein
MVHRSKRKIEVEEAFQKILENQTLGNPRGEFPESTG